MIDNLEQTYNDFPYDSLAVKQTHPWHLYQLAKACGLDSPPLPRAKVLELGCASGGNLIPMAYHLPSTHFVGIDLAQRQIETGQEIISELGLTNIELKHQSISDFQTEDTFDYIICHGLFSWVPQSVSEDVFAICQNYLSQDGVAYISYNTFPGWQIGNIVREILKQKTDAILAPYQKVKIARQTLNDLSILLQKENNAYSELLQKEIALISEHSDHQMLHEHLSPYHFPLTISDFMLKAARYRLMYVSDAFLSNDEQSVTIDELQRLDMLRNRRFRCTLLCHQQNRILKRPTVEDNFEMSFKVADVVNVPEKPSICPLVRYQAASQEVVTNHRHENISLSPIAQTLIPYLNGMNDKEALTQILTRDVEQGELILVDKDGMEIKESAVRHQHTARMCEETLILMARNALFIYPQHP
ncbi:MAG: methyltransferase domain-containing protein [Candidatus Berkiella sp.]